MAQKSIAVLTSGGDAPGMNAAVRAVVRAGINKGMRVYGVYRGYNGLLNGDVQEMNLRSVSDIIGFGGTMLYTARSEEYATPAGIQRAADFCRSIHLYGRLTIGLVLKPCYHIALSHRRKPLLRHTADRFLLL